MLFDKINTSYIGLQARQIILCKYIIYMHAFFINNTFYKQWQAEIGNKNKQTLSNTLRLNFRQTYPNNNIFCVTEII